MTMSELFARYDVAVPRYTSFPPVPHWRATPDTATWLTSMRDALSTETASTSIYVHVPFCEALCTFCGCNTVITRNHAHEDPYVDLVIAELDGYLAAVPDLRDRTVRQLHIGGGTPTFLAPAVLRRLSDAIQSRLPRHGADFEASLEADPRVTTRAHLEALAESGFKRISFGLQDIDPEVQRLVNRRQPLPMTEALCHAARDLGFTSINIDVIYGLPGQTPDSTRVLADALLHLAPDRLAVYGFARVPWIKPAQRKFRDDQVPAGAAKRELAEILRSALLHAGYLEIGLDHYARPQDGLARAAQTGSLHRNFMGYADVRTDVLLGLGVSAISETPTCYHQNEKVLPVYQGRVQAGELPTHRGHELSTREQRRRQQILSLMTTFAAPLDPGEFDDAASFLAPLAADGLVVIEPRVLRVTDRGRPFLRNIAAFFDDEYRRERPSAPVFSTSI